MQLHSVRDALDCCAADEHAITKVQQGGCSLSVQRKTVPLQLNYNWFISAGSPECEEAEIAMGSELTGMVATGNELIACRAVTGEARCRR